MIEVPIERMVPAPAAEVFAFLADMTNNPKWQSGMQRCTWTSAGEIGVGSTYDQVARFVGREIRTGFEVVAFDPGRTITIESRSGPLELRITRSVEPLDADACLVTARIEGTPTGPMRLAAPLMAGKVRRDINADYDRLVDHFT